MKLQKRITPAILLCVLTGCAENHLAAELPMLEGQPVSQAVNYLGPPAQENKISGTTTYSWVNNQSGSFYVPDTSSFPAVVQGGSHPTVAFVEPNTPPIEDSYNWYCRVDITANKGVIVNAKYKGDTAGCELFSDKLKPLVPAAEGRTPAQ